MYEINIVHWYSSVLKWYLKLLSCFGKKSEHWIKLQTVVSNKQRSILVVIWRFSCELQILWTPDVVQCFLKNKPSQKIMYTGTVVVAFSIVKKLLYTNLLLFILYVRNFLFRSYVKRKKENWKGKKKSKHKNEATRSSACSSSAKTCVM